jgi:uncharacterized protein DUF5995
MSEVEGTPNQRIDRVIDRMEGILDRLEQGDARRHFHATYLRSTRAVAEELQSGGFVDPAWVEVWDVAFADLYLDAFEAWERGEAPGAWQVPFATAREEPGLQAVRHVLFGLNVHVNFDLPQALIAVITDDEFEDADVRAKRSRDHEHIDIVLANRVAAEDKELTDKTLLDRILAPLSRRATRRFLREAREKVWRNATVLSRARRRGPEQLEAKIGELNDLCRARVEDLIAPGQVLLKLARRGFGVLLSDT